MDTENLAFLTRTIKYLGFGENSPLNREMEEQMSKRVKEFQLQTEIFYEDCRAEAKLLFLRSDVSERYYLRNYEASVHYNHEQKPDRKQTIFVFKGKGFTFKEAFNLLEGRAVFKKLANSDDISYEAWSQLDFSQKTLHGNYKIKEYKDSYGYDLVKALEIYPIVELQDEKLKANLIRSLQRGNLHPVHFTKNKKQETVFIEANPKSRLINIYPLATRAALKDIIEPEEETQETSLPDASKGSHDEEQEPTPAELEIIGVPSEMEEPGKESPSTTVRPHRKKIYK
jgi:hypothetical protein